MKTILRLAALLLSIGTISELRAATLLGDVISGSYDFPLLRLHFICRRYVALVS
jgi:hypothetical protein